MPIQENPIRFLVVPTSDDGVILRPLSSDKPRKEDWKGIPPLVKKGIVLTVVGENSQGRAIINATRASESTLSFDNPEDF